MRRLLLVFGLLAGGCLDLSGDDTKHYDVNACSGTALADQPCSTLHLTAEPALATAQVTAIAMWVLYSTSIGERWAGVETPMKAPTVFPIAVGLHFPLSFNGFATVDVEALTGPGVVAYGQVTVDPGPASHSDNDLMMQRPGITGCFDGVQDGSEMGVDCGGQACPPCDAGNRCESGTDCKSLNCVFDSNSEQEFCQ